MRHLAFSIVAIAGIAALLLPNLLPAQDPSPSFNRDVRPLLTAKCFACHGPDEDAREAGLRLDQEGWDHDELLDRIESTDPDYVMPPPESGESLSDAQKTVFKQWIESGGKYDKHWAFVKPTRPAVPTSEELIQSARQNRHPAWTDSNRDDPRQRDPVPVAELSTWARNPIDHFVLRKILAAGRLPKPSADRQTLVRRVYLDLTGLPPSPAEAKAFIEDDAPQAYEKLVDRLLESKAYGERWARLWLDLARYADTNGYEKDRPRSIWPYRDWVIRAINDDMPYDQFSIEQMAGDLLQDATESQRIATGFHRNTMINEEGGIDPLEYRYYAMVDRVATTGTIWLGMTTGCAQCHTHKYDPISHTDYYRLMAMMNNADEPDLEIQDQAILAKRAEIQRRIEQATAKLADRFPRGEFKDRSDLTEPKQREKNLEQAFEKWKAEASQKVVNWQPLKPSDLQTNLPKLTALPDRSIFATGDFTKRDVYKISFPAEGPANQIDSQNQPPAFTALRLEVLPDPRLPAGGPGNAYYEGRKGDFFLSEFKASIDGQRVTFADASTSFGKISIGSGSADGENVYDGEGSTGWSTATQEGERNQLVLNFKEPMQGKSLAVEMVFERHFVASLGRFRISLATQQDPPPTANSFPTNIEQLLVNKESNRPEKDAVVLRNYFLATTPVLKDARTGIESLKKSMPRLPRTMVMRERTPDNPRLTRRHHRGEYLQPKEKVIPGLPTMFQGSAPSVSIEKARSKEDGAMNRLEFARWLVGPENPLAARAAVNRYWQAFFGQGLVKSPADLGTQSDPPTHPDLLDWLAIQFQELKWARKQLHRLIVLSATYRQRSEAFPDEYQEDPTNDLYTRGPRFRVEAEIVRDLLLKASGKMSSKMYGPSVYPPQPASVTALAYGSTRWPVSKGEDRFRRSLYTFSKRTAPFAAYLAFDGPTGENCIARRNRSNTPLQSLTLLNDQMFMEYWRSLAKNSLATIQQQTVSDEATDQVRPSSTNDKQIIREIYWRLMTRDPEDGELAAVSKFLRRQRQRLLRGELDASSIAGKPDIELAAWVLVARSLMNLDEVITKP